MKRETKCRKPWKPCSSDLICSDHFVDGIPTESNPDPTLKLGYEALPKPIPRRVLLKVPIEKKQTNVYQPATSLSLTTVLAAEENQNVNNEAASARSRFPLHVPPDHCYAMSENQKLCESCQDKNSIIASLRRKVDALKKENELLKCKKSNPKANPFSLTAESRQIRR